MLEVYLDFKCAGSLLALNPTLAMAGRTGAEVAWRPFSTAERDVPGEGADAATVESHRAVREASRRAIHRKYAELLGVDLAFPESEGRTDLALGALTEIRGDALPFIRAAFAAYWQDQRDLDDPMVVAKILALSGVDHSGDLGETRARFATAQADAEAQGIVDAPAYVIGGQIFIGRQHLPWIDELASQA